MNELKILFVGVGSIAKRHIRNLYLICEQRQIKPQIDVFRSSNRELDTELCSYVKEVYHDYEELPSDYDIIFITNPTEYHASTLKKVHDKGNSFFVEKPVCTLSQLPKKMFDFLQENKLYYVACPLRYTKVLQYVKNHINPEDVYAVRCISSSYLPDWRPGTDYRTTYSAQKELGGGVSIDLIHEWDYITHLFGMPDTVYGFLNKTSHLEISTEDIAIYIGQYQDKTVELHLDYFGRKTIRKMELFMEDETVECDLVESKISFLKKGTCIEFGQERNDFQVEEIKYFLDLYLSGKVENHIENAEKILQLTKGEL